MNWIPGEDYCIRWSDESADDRTEEQLDKMVKEMRKTANNNGFDLQCHGSWKSFKIIGAEEDEIINKYQNR